MVARAYVDQLNRTKGIDASRAAAVLTAMDRVEKTQRGRAGTALIQLDTLATQLETDAATASAQDATRLRALAALLKARAAALR